MSESFHQNTDGLAGKFILMLCLGKGSVICCDIIGNPQVESNRPQ
jgi:hypothetical protein